MKDGDSVTEHLNAFNTVVSQLSSVDIKISYEDKFISLLCSLPDSWDSLVIAIGSNATALQLDEIVSALLTEEMRRKNMDNQNGDALSVVCWKCGKEGHFKRECKYKAPDKGKGYDDDPSTEAKTTSDEGGDVYLASSSTHVDHEAWLIDSSASFHFTPHREGFCEYEKYDGGDVFLGDDRKARIVGRGELKLKLQGGTVRTLPGVLHIPVLARNIISFEKEGSHKGIIHLLSVQILLSVTDDDHRTMKEAVDSEDGKLWKEAMVDEMASLHKNEAWDLLELLAGRNPLAANGCSRRRQMQKGR
eukprot:PITA_03017